MSDKARHLQVVPKDEPKDEAQSPSLTEDQPTTTTAVTAEKVLKLLKEGAAKNTDVEIAGEKISNPKEALAKLKEAFSLVKTYFKNHLVVGIDLDDIQFQKLGGDKAGESTGNATLLDPKLHRHPARVVAVVLAHELRHAHDSIQNEGLVQEAVDTVFKSEDIGHKYGMMVADFRKFAGRFDRGGNVKRGSKKIYRLYAEEKFDEIFKIYEKNYVDKQKTEDKKDAAFEFFKSVFPELDYSDEWGKDGDFGVKKLPSRIEAEAPAEISEQKKAA
ncbi:hypothetical protein A3B60_02105 [Candidatus Peregrinibacteria bacterium RIFCSPLOWO2_01_FULL_39_12]|nr:MAG: hypothetical protein A3B60_02105 [Candidatus Peregrinibacteria bacterium RIFCSPLOWO2_01_FULL_39_12]OGJ43033.1 MAG: hypothetical protein A3I58_02060 [Candidatus Peregrinibacteria bacterium RIFCSPLOWO2_02_FULL_39_10]